MNSICQHSKSIFFRKKWPLVAVKFSSLLFLISCGLASKVDERTKKNNGNTNTTPPQPAISNDGNKAISAATATPSWKIVYTQEGSFWRDVHFSSKNVGYAVGGADWRTTGIPSLAKTTDGGKTWSKKSFPKEFSWIDWVIAIDCEDDNLCYAAGRGGTIFRTLDGGEVWNRANVSPNYNGWLHAVAATKKDHGILAGGTCYDPAYPGTANFLRSTDGTASDFTAGLVFAADHYYCSLMGDITCPAPGICFAATTGGGQVIHTLDNGVTWEPKIPEGYWTPTSWYGIGCSDVTNCWAAGYVSVFVWDSVAKKEVKKGRYGGIERTTDGGNTWEQLLASTEDLINLRFWDIKMIDKTHGYAVGCQGVIDNEDRCTGEGVVFKTEDGKIWTRMPKFTDADLMNVHPIAPDNIFVVDFKGNIWHYGIE